MSKQTDSDEPLVRLTVSVSASQVDGLKLAARRADASVSEVVREAVDDFLEKSGPRPLPSLIGAFRSGETDLSERVDEVIREAMEEEFRRDLSHESEIPTS